jgi:hypothetical protein
MSFLLAKKQPQKENGGEHPKKPTTKFSQDMFIMSSTNRFYLYWISLNTLCCLASSYVYACMAAFKVEDVVLIEAAHDDNVKMIEACFSINCSTVQGPHAALCPPPLPYGPADYVLEYSNYFNYGFESMFAISIVMRFFVDYYEEGKQFPVRDLTSIAKNYLKTDFIFDFIPLIPLQELALPRGYARFFYIIKVFRLFNGFKLLNVEHIMEYIKKFYKSKVDRMIQSDVEIGEDIVRDNNNIRTLLVIKYIIRLAKLFYIIVSICYFLGSTWYIFCELILEHQERADDIIASEFVR